MVEASKYLQITIPLPQNTRKNSHDYIQVCRGEKACIYSQWFDGERFGYEVILIREKSGRYVKGIWLEAREKFPSNEDFGPYAKAVSSWDKAKEWFDKAEKEKYNRFPLV